MTPEERQAALETEAMRIKARLDQLARQLDGDPAAWLSIIERMPPTVAEVVIDKALAEARQQALALATITKTLATLGIETAPASQPDVADEVARRRAAKLAEAQGQ